LADSLIGSFNTNIGGRAGRYNQLGNNVINIGYLAGTMQPDGVGYMISYDNTICIGWNTGVQASNFGKIGSGVTNVGVSGVLSSKQTIATLTNNAGITLTASNICNNVGITRAGAPGAGFSDTTDTAANLLSRIPGYETGQGLKFFIQNTTGQTMTLLGGTDVTLSGTMTIAAGKGRWFSLRCTSGALKTVTIFNIGSFDI